MYGLTKYNVLSIACLDLVHVDLDHLFDKKVHMLNQHHITTVEPDLKGYLTIQKKVTLHYRCPFIAGVLS